MNVPYSHVEPGAFQPGEPAAEAPASGQGQDVIERLTQAIVSYGPSEMTDEHMARLLAALAVSSNINLPIKSMLAAISPDRGLTRISDIEAVMGRLGFHVYRGPLKSSSAFRGMTWGLRVPDRGKPTVLVSSAGKWLSMDGAGDVETLSQVEAVRPRGEFLTFDFESEDHSLSKTRRYHTGHSWLRALLDRIAPVAIALSITSVVIAIASVIMPLSIAVFFSQIVGDNSWVAVGFLFGSFSLIAFVKLLAMRHRARVIAWIATRLDYLVATSTFRAILKLSPMLSERAAPHSQAARLRSFDSVRDYLTSPQATQMLEFPAAFLSLLAVWILDPLSVIAILCGIGMMLLLFFISRSNVRVQTSVAAEEATEIQRLAIETIEKHDIIRMLGMQRVWSQRLSAIAAREKRAQQKLAMVSATTEALSGFFSSMTLLGVMVAGTHDVWAGNITAGALLPIIVLAMRAVAPFHALNLSVMRLEQMRRSFSQINEFMDVPPENPVGERKRLPPPIRGSVGFSSVTFRAGDRQPVFAGLDLEVAPGEIIGISGAAGSGKSTILKMILGMVDTSIGALRIDGIDSRQLPALELRRRISYVPQSPAFLPGSLRENLYYANPLASPDHVAKVLEWSGLAKEFEHLPGGWDYAPDNAEDFLATPELRFRLAFAQSRLINSRLLLIDELPNGLVDGPVGQLLRDELVRSRKHRTVFIVTQRSDLLPFADRVIALQYGRVPKVLPTSVFLERAA